jgi:glycerol-3-phosphate dehydrogenase (NAD(P)+)
MPYSFQTITILGAGAWGCTLATLFQAKGARVVIWEHQAHKAEILREKRHPFGVEILRLDSSIVITHDLAEALNQTDLVVFVSPSQTIFNAAHQVANALGRPPKALLLASKGLDIERRKTLAACMEIGLPGIPLAVVSGPCIAREVAQGVPTSVVVASANSPCAEGIIELLNTPRLRCYQQSDVLGVELGGALKNVIAVAAGISDGLGFGENSKSALLTRGLAEMTRFAVALGANPLTITGLAGLGDLAVTCFSPHSRNRTFGEYLGKGHLPIEAKAKIGMTVEGEPTASAALEMAREHGLELPITECVVAVCQGKIAPAEAVHRLMTRELKAEF